MSVYQIYEIEIVINTELYILRNQIALDINRNLNQFSGNHLKSDHENSKKEETVCLNL